MGRPRWATRVLAEIHRLVARRLVRFTFKASEELSELSLDEEDAMQILAGLSFADLVGRLESVRTPEWLYVFKPEVGGSVLYVKLIVRAECLVVSFHEDEGVDDD
jgi:Motility quorum-sensing regulator, toxin of MqsA